jgi:hypothetical protein
MPLFQVKIVSKQNDMEVFMEAGGVFGNLIPSPQHKISVTITALSNVDILFMETQDFYNAIEVSSSPVQMILLTDTCRNTQRPKRQ